MEIDGLQARPDAIVLCGGQSKRFGSDKCRLIYDGTTFLERIVFELDFCGQTVLSVRQGQKLPEIGLRAVEDEYPDCGPLSGIYSGMKACTAEIVLVVACDMPLFCRDLGRYLCSRLTDGVQAVVPVTPDGRIHPLCAVYTRRLVEQIRQRLETHSYKTSDLLKEISTCYVPMQEENGDAERLININSRQDYQELIGNLTNRAYLRKNI